MFKLIVNIGFQAVLKLFFSVLSLKVVSYYAGPSGMAALGQLQAFLQIASAGASSVTTAGVVKHISEKTHPEYNVVAVSFALLVIFSSLLLLLFSGVVEFISDYFFEGAWVTAIFLLPLAAFFVGVSNIFISYYNGRQEYRKYFYYSVLYSFLMMLVTILIAFLYGLDGAVYSVVVSPILVGLVLILLFKKFSFSKVSYSFNRDWSIASSLLKFSFMAIGSAVVVYGGNIYLRDYISTHVSVSSAGLWYSATRLSDIYMGITSVIFSTILLPRYTSFYSKELKKQVVDVFFIAVLFSIVMVFCIQFFSDFIVKIIYGKDFYGASEILNLYSIGDGVKVITWVFLYVSIAKQRVGFYIVYEVFSAACFVSFSILLYKYFDFSYMPLGYLAQSLLSLCIVILWYIYSCRYSRLAFADNK